MNVFKLALRNVGRNGRRTVVTTGAMALAASAMVVFTSLGNGFTGSMERNALGMDLGEVQGYASGYRDDPDLYTLIEDSEQRVAALEDAGFQVAPRLYGFGLAAAGTSSAGVELRGIDLARERRVTELHAHLRHGQWLDAADPTGVVLGRKVARTLGVGVGDELVVLGQAADGSMANELYRVRGILRPVGERVDRAGVYLPEAAWRDLFLMQRGAHALAAIRMDRDVPLDVAVGRFEAAAPGLDVHDWRQLQPLLATMIDNSQVSLSVLLLLVYAAIASLILNAMLMSVFERIREFGVMKAIGVTPAQVGATIFLEAGIQAAFASGVAVVVGLPISFWLESTGIDLRSLAGSFDAAGIAIDPVWHARVTARCVVEPVISLLVIAGLAVTWPALKAALIAPLDAIRHR
jgi:ABC-type lipoprotein release transport system permease subunit